MTCPDSSWKTGLVEPISSQIFAGKCGENGGKPLKKQKSETQLDEWYWEKTSKNQFYVWHLDDWKVPACSQDPDESNHVSNIRLCKAKVGGIKPQSGVSQNIFFVFCPNQPFFGKQSKKSPAFDMLSYKCHTWLESCSKCGFFGKKSFGSSLILWAPNNHKTWNGHLVSITAALFKSILITVGSSAKSGLLLTIQLYIEGLQGWTQDLVTGTAAHSVILGALDTWH